MTGWQAGRREEASLASLATPRSHPFPQAIVKCGLIKIDEICDVGRCVPRTVPPRPGKDWPLLLVDLATHRRASIKSRWRSGPSASNLSFWRGLMADGAHARAA